MKSLTILSGKAMIVELPEGATNLQLLTVHQGSKSFPSLKYDRPDLVRGFIDLPPGNWRIIGMLSEVTADDVAAITGQYYNKYNERYVHYPSASTRVTPIDDIESAIVAEGYTFKSTPKPENKDFYWGYLDDLAKWETAQSRVLSRERCLLLRRVDG